MHNVGSKYFLIAFYIIVIFDQMRRFQSGHLWEGVAYEK